MFCFVLFSAFLLICPQFHSHHFLGLSLSFHFQFILVILRSFIQYLMHYSSSINAVSMKQSCNLTIECWTLHLFQFQREQWRILAVRNLCWLMMYAYWWLLPYWGSFMSLLHSNYFVSHSEIIGASKMFKQKWNLSSSHSFFVEGIQWFKIKY